MQDLAKKYVDRLPELKKNVEEWHEYFSENIERYNEFMKFVFSTSLTQQDIGVLQTTGKPTIEFNILEAYVSRLRGEFAKQMPSVSVRAADGVPLSALNAAFIQTIKVIEAHLRAIFFDGANDMLEYNVYTDLLAGGFSALKVFTEYVNEMSFEQKICVERVFDPTLCGFDPLARDSHKGDGRYCFELYPMTRERFENEFGKNLADDIKFTRSLSGFSWSFQNDDEDIVLVCDFYEKKSKREKIIKLSNGHAVSVKEYEEFLIKWNEMGHIEQPPMPVGEPRWTVIGTICRYRFCENRVLDYKETDYKFLPLVFVDGNSVNLQTNGSSKQMTRPFCYHSKGIQRLKNFAGQSLANELENTIQHKFIVAIESIPTDYLNAYTDTQKPNTLIYNHFLDSRSPEITLPPPREVARTPIPPEISATFSLSDQMTQAILGSYDGAAGINDADMSGISFARSAIQSNSASMPYIVGYIKGLNRIAQIIVDLIPKYYRTPRSLPILLPSGKRDYQMINKSGSLYMDYDPKNIEIRVEAGVNFAIQKEMALKTITSMMSASPLFGQFMNEYGLQMLLDNIEIRGIEELKEKAAEFEQQLAKQRQQAEQANAQAQQMQMQQMQEQSQMQQQQSMMAMEEAKRNLQAPTDNELALMELQEKSQIDAANLAIKERDSQTKYLELISKIRTEEVQAEVGMAKADAENARSEVNLAIELSKHQADEANNQVKVALEVAKHHHEVNRKETKEGNDGREMGERTD